jgi:arginine N-succinyltransferase
MEFEDADLANSAMGNQIISDLLPRHPIYVALLPEAAKECLGKPHDSAAPAYKMLLKEGFAFHGYIDVFDGGPLVDARIDDIKTVKDSKVYTVRIDDSGDAPVYLLAAGYLQSFRVTRGAGKVEGEIMTIGADAAKALGVKAGDELRAVKW